MTVILMGALLLTAELMVDHVTVAGSDLKELQARLAAVGIRSDYGGAHSNGATEMALTSFPDGSYLELIAIQPKPDQKAVAEHYWSKQMRENAGPTAWAVRVKDVAAEAARLKKAGIDVSTPSRSGRKRPDGVRLEWETARVGAEPNGTFFPFLIRDFTARDARAFPKGHPTMTKFTGIKRVVIAVRDLQASISRYQKAYGLSAISEKPNLIPEGRAVAFDGTPVILVTPGDANSWIAQRIASFGEGPCAFILGSGKTGEVSWFDANKLGWHLGYEK